MTDITKVVLTIPRKDEPGYLRRTRRMYEISEAMENESATMKDLDEFIQIILKYVSVPVDRKEAEDALLDASEEQILELFDAIKGLAKKQKEGVVPLANGGK
jgi:hypothetical protein